MAKACCGPVAAYLCAMLCFLALGVFPKALKSKLDVVIALHSDMLHDTTVATPVVHSLD